MEKKQSKGARRNARRTRGITRRRPSSLDYNHKTSIIEARENLLIDRLSKKKPVAKIYDSNEEDEKKPVAKLYDSSEEIKKAIEKFSDNEEEDDLIIPWDTPRDVTSNILSRLPIRCLSLISSVSDKYLQIVAEPHFSALRAKNTEFTSLYGAWNCWFHKLNGCLVELYENGNCVVTDYAEEVDHEWGPFLSIIGSINGIFCVRDNHELGPDKLVLYNPIRQEFYKIIDSLHRPIYYTFSYSNSTKLYKIFRVVEGLSKPEEEYQILTIGVDRSWRRLPSLFPEETVLAKTDAVLCAGSPNWLIPGSDDGEYCIWSLDVESEKTRRISIPPQAANANLRLLICNDHICVAKGTFSAYEAGNKIWKLEDYEKPLWKVIELPPFVYPISDMKTLAPLPWATKHGSFVLRGEPDGFCWLYRADSGQYTRVQNRLNHDLLWDFNPNFSLFKEIIGEPK